MHKALYRSYRPQNFEDVVGQEHIIRTLKNQIENNNVGHAYLFSGTRGTGKTSTAKIFAEQTSHPYALHYADKQLGLSYQRGSRRPWQFAVRDHILPPDDFPR